jgi:hypothetical protein
MNLFNRFTKKDRDAMKHPKFQPVIGFEEASSLKFKALDDDIRLKLRKLILQITLDNDIEDRESNMLRSNSHSCKDLDQVLQFIGSVWQTDYSDNQLRSKKEGWDFYYFVPKMHLKSSLLLIIANLYYPSNEFENNVLYNLVTIKTDGSSYLVWDMST